jgi:hypothetical protein
MHPKALPHVEPNLLTEHMQAIQIYFELNPSIGALVTMRISEGF